VFGVLVALLSVGPASAKRLHHRVYPKQAVRPVVVNHDALKSDTQVIPDDSPLKEFAQVLKSVFNEGSMQRARVGFLVTSLKTQKVLAERDADVLLNPASNVKLITTVAALSILKPDFRFKTEYYAQGPIEGGVLKGDLVVKGYGDPSIVTERLQRVARDLELRGLKQIAGNIVLDDSYFDDNNRAKGWESERYNPKAYAAPIGALSFNHNTVDMFVRPTASGQPAFFALDPPIDYLRVEGSIATGDKKWRPQISIFDEDGFMRVKVAGQVSTRHGHAEFRRRIFDPKRYFGSALAYFLEQEGILFSAQVISGQLQPGAKLLLVDRSPPLTQIVGDTNKYSSNFMAEMLVKALGAQVALPASFDNGLQVISQFLEREVGFKKGEYRLGNGSGLNDANRFSARQLVKLLTYANQNFEIASEFVSSLGVAGAQGTISSRMRNTPAQRKLRAKTGTLSGISALSGYVATQDDDTLAFSIIVQGHGSPTYKVCHLQDRICEALAQVHAGSAANIAAAPHEEVFDEDWIDAEDDSEVEEIPGGG
jgi:D-alanyl-D-alanine carboxypeptidase/D-alanyl-D-alanine-endopeptidase (penicillin-binding protein 4)